MDFQVLHDYMRLARRGQVPLLRCLLCDSNKIVTRLTRDDDPALHCMKCNTLSILGMARYDQIRDAVNTHAKRDTTRTQ